MHTVTYTQIRNNFAATMNRVCDDHAPIIITRQNQSPVVMMSLEDYNGIEETLYLIKSSKNATRILKAMTDVNQDKFIEKEIIL
jgi:antitoxin YefM